MKYEHKYVEREDNCFLSKQYSAPNAVRGTHSFYFNFLSRLRYTCNKPYIQLYSIFSQAECK